MNVNQPKASTPMTDIKSAEGEGLFTVLSEEECRSLLEVSTIGRLAFHSTAGLELLPLNFLFLDGCVYARVDRSSVIGDLAEGADEVVFQTDYHEDLYRQAWSVTVKGRIDAVTDVADLAELSTRRQLKPWATGERTLYLRLSPVSFSGRKLVRYAR